MQIHLHVFLLSCSCLLVWFWTFIHIIYPFYLIISANLSHLTEAKSSVVRKAIHFVNKEYINLGHSEPERTQCRKRMGNIAHTRKVWCLGYGSEMHRCGDRCLVESVKFSLVSQTVRKLFLV